MARKGGGARGRAGAPVPRKAPIHTSPKVGSEAWHSAKREAFAHQAAQARAGHADRKAKLHPPEHHGGFKCTNCGWGGWHLHKVSSQGGGHHPTLAFQGCAHCGTLHATQLHLHKTQLEELDALAVIAKTIDTTETNVQRQDVGPAGPGVVGHRTACPRGGGAPCGKAVAGRCSLCHAQVSDHAAIGKTIDDTVGLLRKAAGL